MSLTRPIVRTAIVGATVALTALGLSPLASANNVERTYQPAPGQKVHVTYTDNTGMFCVKFDSTNVNAEALTVSLTPKPPKGATASSAFAYKVQPNTRWNCDDTLAYADEDTLYTYAISSGNATYDGRFHS